jgi:hypothetical protein
MAIPGMHIAPAQIIPNPYETVWPPLVNPSTALMAA